MPNIKSAKKRMRTTETKTLRNRKIKAKVKTYTKNFKMAIEEEDIQTAKKLYPEVTKQIDMATSKGVLHKNAASRMKSRLAVSLNKLEESNQTSA